jgi:hypothetical protein
MTLSTGLIFYIAGVLLAFYSLRFIKKKAEQDEDEYPDHPIQNEDDVFRYSLLSWIILLVMFASFMEMLINKDTEE